MAKRILLIAAVLIVAGFLYVGYTTYDAKRAGENGDVTSSDSPSERSRPLSKAPGEAATATKPSTSNSPAYPSSDQSGKSSPDSELSPQPGTRIANTATPPASDTISPDPPNGMIFSGTGHYQLYRQGNLTWRLNTDTGQSCILFATDEEWKKPKVLRAGCGKK
ncbi:MAG: hypothetical protein JWM43_2537 [Acidobacteriaceae bacterium]|nr:hypothetical protein [Acidobacteriaceae bacterium]